MNVLVRLGDRSARLAQAIVPDPFVISILLAVVAFAIGLLVNGAGPLVLLQSFAGGMLETALIAFAFEMALILVTGHALAAAPGVRRLLERLADLPRTTGSAASMVAGTAMVLGLLNWGLGLVGGAFLAREVGRSFRRRGLALNYGLVGAAGYMGMLIWHGGLSGSAPLKVATAGAFGPAIDVTQTLFSPLNLVVTAGLLLVNPTVFFLLGGSTSQAAEPTPELEVAELEQHEALPPGPVRWMERSPVVMACLALPLLVALGSMLWAKGTAAVNLQTVILLFWAVGLVLHGTPLTYARAFGEGAAGAAGILLQFPIYFGVMAVMRESGAMAAVAHTFANWALALRGTIPPEVSASVGTFLSASLINLFVPSGGGQWALQSPLILESAQALGLERAPLVMAFSYGDQLTNMLQPFWALPLLSITGLGARHVMGYTLLAMLAALPVFLLGLALL
ncbi:MAG TPA: TIGR00366 family protein [Myxococcaceae bacterium]|nr:TIGR00366 family protein [Myxococcaceae bacterium]